MIITMKERTCFFNRFLQVSIFLLISTLNFRNRFYSCRKWACLLCSLEKKSFQRQERTKMFSFKLNYRVSQKRTFRIFKDMWEDQILVISSKYHSSCHLGPFWSFWLFWPFFWFILASFCLYWPFWLFWIYLIIFFSVFFWLFWLFGHKKITKNNQKRPTIIKNNQNNQICPKMTKNNQK